MSDENEIYNKNTKLRTILSIKFHLKSKEFQQINKQGTYVWRVPMQYGVLWNWMSTYKDTYVW